MMHFVGPKNSCLTFTKQLLLSLIHCELLIQQYPIYNNTPFPSYCLRVQNDIPQPKPVFKLHLFLFTDQLYAEKCAYKEMSEKLDITLGDMVEI